MLFTASAQTHIFPEIRIDAVRFLGLLLDFIPVPLVQGWDSTDSTNGKRILEGYLGNLSAGIKYGDGDGKFIPGWFEHLLEFGNSVIINSSNKFWCYPLPDSKPAVWLIDYKVDIALVKTCCSAIILIFPPDRIIDRKTWKNTAGFASCVACVVYVTVFHDTKCLPGLWGGSSASARTAISSWSFDFGWLFPDLFPLWLRNTMDDARTGKHITIFGRL